ncbi:DNA-binding anti-repressor SinI [Niallia endozanthoxylica]|uniref:DNA-binding anti-repressor SinI n=1 Tax=Niallia endozanthoxylica TaxID=2036016 RepID=A0A5J5I7K6_9BACI|nr:DNA-binding anti-repressor SinI [Niallia endozanthoxylica]
MKAKEEWTQLIQEAKHIGLTIEEVRDFIWNSSAALSEEKEI